MGKVLIFMDNASIHKCPEVRNEIIKYDIELLYNVPYESSFNPIERVFKSIKSKVVNDLPQNLEDVKSKYKLAIDNISEKIVVNSWKSSIKDMCKSMKAS